MTEKKPCAQDGADVIVHFGLIRNGQANVLLHARPEVAGSLRLIAIGPHERISGRWEFIPAPVDDAQVTEVDDPSLFGLVRLRARSKLRAGHHPVVRFEVHSDGEALCVDYGTRYQLQGLFYSSPEEFARAQVARRRGNRPLDKQCQMFLARQMVHAYQDIAAPGARELVLTMAASYAYRATDLLHAEDARASLALIDGIIAQLNAEAASDWTENALVSMFTAKWHAAAAAQEQAAMESSLKEILSRVDSIAENSTAFLLCYNSVRSLCVLAGYAIIRGDGSTARACFAGIQRILRGGGSKLTLYPAHLREFAMTCRVASPVGYFDEAIERALTDGGAKLATRLIDSLRGTMAEKAKELLIKPSIRTDNPDALLPLVAAMATS
jgi:ribosomal protein L34E